MVISPLYSQLADIVLERCDALTFVEKLPAESVQLIVTSPPYNIGKSYETRVSLDAYLDIQKLLIEELARILSPLGSICWQVGSYVNDFEVYPLDIYFYPIFKSLDLQLRNRIIWHYGHGLHAKKRLPTVS